jgi:hypothetical protein
VDEKLKKLKEVHFGKKKKVKKASPNNMDSTVLI